MFLLYSTVIVLVINIKHNDWWMVMLAGRLLGITSTNSVCIFDKIVWHEIYFSSPFEKSEQLFSYGACMRISSDTW